MLSNVTFKLFQFKSHRSLCKRFINDVVRVRFAPSPTGYLHLGGLRTALYNHLFAKSKNGTTILRIEDTDLTRKVAGATECLIEDLSWCGINFDEGPYFQSERKDLYQKHVQQLLDQGDAYYCFCSNTRLELIRKEAIKTGEIPKYDNHCRNLPEEEVKARLKNGEPCCIRFKLSAIDEPFNDLICGPVLHDISANEGDPVIIKNDGWPTYHFANVVDDHLMNISHVLRGVEWQVSTSKHLLLYRFVAETLVYLGLLTDPNKSLIFWRAFKWDPPEYGHLPLLMNPDGTKISKRQGDSQIRFLREAGLFPNAVLNFIIRFGGGFDIEQKEKDERSFTMDELIERFDVGRIKSGFCKTQLEHMNGYNNLEINRMMETESGRKILVDMTREVLQKYFENSELRDNLLLDECRIISVLQLLKDRIFFVKDLVEDDYRFLWVWSDEWYSNEKNMNEAIQEVITIVKNVNWNSEDIKKALKNLDSNKLGLKLPEIFKTLRYILTGIKTKGPSIAMIMSLLGREEVLLRLSKSVEMGLKNSTCLEESKDKKKYNT